MAFASSQKVTAHKLLTSSGVVTRDLKICVNVERVAGTRSQICALRSKHAYAGEIEMDAAQR